MAISIGQRDEDIEGIPRQREEIVRLRAFTAKSRHRGILPIFAIANNGIVYARFQRSPLARKYVSMTYGQGITIRQRTTPNVQSMNVCAWPASS